MQPFKKFTAIALVGLVATGCSATKGLFAQKDKPDTMVEVTIPSDEAPRPKPRPNSEDTDLEAIKTVTDAEIAAATARPTARPEQDLGTTIVSLGLLDRDGLWLRTPLVKSEAAGRVVYSKLGNSANVTLLPLKGDKGAGSQLSLAVMQVLGIPFAELAEVQVFVR